MGPVRTYTKGSAMGFVVDLLTPLEIERLKKSFGSNISMLYDIYDSMIGALKVNFSRCGYIVDINGVILEELLRNYGVEYINYDSFSSLQMNLNGRLINYTLKYSNGNSYFELEPLV